MRGNRQGIGSGKERKNKPGAMKEVSFKKGNNNILSYMKRKGLVEGKGRALSARKYAGGGLSSVGEKEKIHQTRYVFQGAQESGVPADLWGMHRSIKRETKVSEKEVKRRMRSGEKGGGGSARISVVKVEKRKMICRLASDVLL